MRIFLALCTILILAMGCFAQTKEEMLSFRARLANPDKPIAPFQRVDLVATGGLRPQNPFDPDEVTLEADVQEPDGTTRTIPGFWYQPFVRETRGQIVGLKASGEPGWRIRLCPSRVGAYKVTVRLTFQPSPKTANTLITTMALVDFNVTPGRSALPDGFARRTPGNSRYFQLDSGKPFFLVGENVCWNGGERGLGDYDAWFPALSKAGGNFARLWMAFSPLETKETGLGRYNLENAAHFDDVLENAERNGLRCMLALGTYGEFTTGGTFNEGAWKVNPYNAANGGPVPADTPEAFFTNEQARKMYRRKLRYVIARYGAYPSVAFWEFWNEKDGAASWFAEMAKDVRQSDPYRHLITNSDQTTGRPDIWSIPEFDLSQTHRYGDEGSLVDIAPGLPEDIKAHETFNKPHLMGEFGISFRGPDDKFDPHHTATNLHNGLWAGALSGAAGGSVIWWWDNYIHPRNLYGEFTGLARFAAQIDWPRRHFERIAVPPVATITRTPPTYRDLLLSPTTGWGAKATSPIVVAPDGGTVGGPLLSVLFGAEKPDQRTVQTLQVDLPTASRLTLRVLTVSNFANLRVSVDGKSVGDFSLNAAPGKGDDYESTKQFPEYGGIYQALFNKDRVVDVPAGRHTITVENTTGDWLQIGSYRFANALSSRYAGVRVYALADKQKGETIAWLQDTDSNWKNDFDGKQPRTISGARLTLPVPNVGTYMVTWWDTRAGKVIARKMVMVIRGGREGSSLEVAVPEFTRDIAVRVARP